MRTILALLLAALLAVPVAAAADARGNCTGELHEDRCVGVYSDLFAYACVGTYTYATGQCDGIEFPPF